MLRTLPRKAKILAIGALAPIAMFAQQQTPPSNLPPARDTAFTQRTIIRPDSLLASWKHLGRLSIDSTELSNEITKRTMRTLAYSQLADALALSTPWMPLSHGGFGQHDAISVLGGANVDLGVSIDGRPLSDPWSGMFQLVQAQPAALERVEVLTGTDAVGLAPGMTLSAVNMQSMIHNTATPYTALWYHQGGGDIIGADATFSQNVAENLNLSVGVRRSGARGRYVNTGFDIWNVRAGIRWTMSAQQHLLVEYQLASHNTDLWGGLRTIALDSRFTEDAAPVVNVELRDESRRHDLTATFTQILGDDSSSVLSTVAYGTAASLLRLRDSTLYTSLADTGRGVTIHGGMVGGIARLDQQLGTLRLRVGVGAEYRTTGQSVYTAAQTNVLPQAFAHLRIPFSEELTAKVAARFAYEQQQLLSGAGVGLVYGGGASRYTFDAATIERAPTPNEGFSLTPERHFVVSLAGNWNVSQLQASVTVFGRRIESPIVASVVRQETETIPLAAFANGSSRLIAGAVASALWRTGPIEIGPTVRLHSSMSDSQSDERFPLVMASLRVAFVYEVGKNSVRLGVSGSTLTSAMFQQFVAPSWTYASPLTSTGVQYDGLNAFLVAIVGNATVRASFENILGQRWYTTALAPEIARSIRLSVDWSFFD